MIIEPMFEGVAYSEPTKLAKAIGKEDTTITVVNPDVLPDGPNIAVIGIDEFAETITYESKNGNILIGVSRGVEGIAKDWNAEEFIARNWTNYDYEKLVSNVHSINKATEIVEVKLDTKADETSVVSRLDTKADETSVVSRLNLKANLVSPSFTGAPTAPTPATATNNTQIATTAFVKSNIPSLPLLRDSLEYRGINVKIDNFNNPAGVRTNIHADFSEQSDCITLPKSGWNKILHLFGNHFVSQLCFSDITSGAADSNAGGLYFRGGYSASAVSDGRVFSRWAKVFADNTTCTPQIDNKYDLGSPTYRFCNIYAGTGTINTSDKNEKEKIKPLSEITKDFIMSLNPVEYEFKGEEYLRTHYGLIAQEVEQAMYKNGMNSLDFAGLIISPITEEVETEEFKEEKITDEDGREKITKVPVMKTEIIGETYGLRYEEFIAPLIKVVQLQEDKIAKLEEKIDKLENLINK